MNRFCMLGIHDWVTKVTARPGVTVFRCYRCNMMVRTTKGRRRRQKRLYLLGALLLSLLLWYVTVALGLTGHTKVLWGSEHVAHTVKHAAKKVDHKIRKIVGDPGQ